MEPCEFCEGVEGTHAATYPYAIEEEPGADDYCD